ncbi:MAG: NYN domain-containing protein [Thermogutta sp.]
MIRYLIDGYNFLNCAGIEVKDSGAAGITPLGVARQALLDFLVEHLTPEEARETLVVFDAHSPPRPLPTEFEYCGISVKFAVRYPDADSLLERLINEHTSPRKLTVISSDHRIQRAARRRRAKFVDSEKWYRELLIRASYRGPTSPRSSDAASKLPDVSNMNTEDWLRLLGVSEDATSEDPEAIPQAQSRQDSEARTPGEAQPTPEVPKQGAAASSEEQIQESLPELLPAVDFGFTPDELEQPIDALDERDLARMRRPRHRRPPRRQG